MIVHLKMIVYVIHPKTIIHKKMISCFKMILYLNFILWHQNNHPSQNDRKWEKDHWSLNDHTSKRIPNENITSKSCRRSIRSIPCFCFSFKVGFALTSKNVCKEIGRVLHACVLHWIVQIVATYDVRTEREEINNAPNLRLSLSVHKGSQKHCGYHIWYE